MPSATGLLLHSAATYDLTVWLFTRGRERAFREQLLRFARLQVGESVLDVGCGTGTMAIVAKGQVGPTGKVYGIDPSPEMITRASRKARKAGVNVMFQNAFAQALPFPEARFDVVMTTVMLHHLPRPARQELAAEMRRVLRPGGRALVIDFGQPATRKKRSLFSHRHGGVDPREIIALLTAAGLECADSGAVGDTDLQFVVATRPQ